jgi:hypothetical protein
MSDRPQVQRFPCSECDQTFTSKGGLTQHLLRKHHARFSEPSFTRISHPQLNGVYPPQIPFQVLMNISLRTTVQCQWDLYPFNLTT